MLATRRRALILAFRPIRVLVPLRARKRVVAALGRRPRLPFRDVLSLEALRDYIEREPTEAHRFLWANHLAYAQSYEVAVRFGGGEINASRRMLFEDLRRYLVGRGISPETDVHSVFELGCSLGYLLRHLETSMFTAAEVLEGIDIDRHAIDAGTTHLARIGSKVRLATADVADLDEVLGSRTIDVILCLGVLLYLPEDEAARVVATIIRHTGTVAVFSALAHPGRDNADLAASDRRERDATMIHNVDRMVRDAGGSVAWRRYEGARQVDGNTIYFVLATPGSS